MVERRFECKIWRFSDLGKVPLNMSSIALSIWEFEDSGAN